MDVLRKSPAIKSTHSTPSQSNRLATYQAQSQCFEKILPFGNTISVSMYMIHFRHQLLQISNPFLLSPVAISSTNIWGITWNENPWSRFYLLNYLINISFTLSREYRLVKNRYSLLLFTRTWRFPLCQFVQEQSTNMTLWCQYLPFVWRHRSTVVTSQFSARKDRPYPQWQIER